MPLSFDGDNRAFVLEHLLPSCRLNNADKKVVRWAYEGGYELKSDGETLVKDMFMDGVIKSPAGVTHDYINRVPHHATPDGHQWTRWQANSLYRRILKAQGSGFRLRWRRWMGLTLSGYTPIASWWR